MLLFFRVFVSPLVPSPIIVDWTTCRYLVLRQRLVMLFGDRSCYYYCTAEPCNHTAENGGICVHYYLLTQAINRHTRMNAHLRCHHKCPASRYPAQPCSLQQVQQAPSLSPQPLLLPSGSRISFHGPFQPRLKNPTK